MNSEVQYCTTWRHELIREQILSVLTVPLDCHFSEKLSTVGHANFYHNVPAYHISLLLE